MPVGLVFNSLIVGSMESGLRALATITGSGGVAIILFTLAIRLLLLPLGLRQGRSARAMAALAPELAALKERYRHDRERLAREQMRLYQERGISPAAGCLPLLVQMPVLYGLYFALRDLGQSAAGAEYFHEPFLWVPSLAQPDALTLGTLHVPGLLPLLMAAAQFLATSVAVPLGDPEQQSLSRAMSLVMPLSLLLFSVTLPSGLVLYWLASSLFSAGQQYLVLGRAGVRPGWTWLRGIAGGTGEGISGAAEPPAQPPAGRAAGEGRLVQREKRLKRRGRRRERRR